MRTRKTSIKVPETKIIIQEVLLALINKMTTEELQVAVATTEVAAVIKDMMEVDITDNNTMTIMTNITIIMINTMTIMAEKTPDIEAIKEEAITTKAMTASQDEVDQAVVVALTRIKVTTTKIINKGTKTTTTLAIEDSKIKRINHKTIIMTTEWTILNNNNILRKELKIHKM